MGAGYPLSGPFFVRCWPPSVAFSRSALRATPQAYICTLLLLPRTRHVPYKSAVEKSPFFKSSASETKPP